MEMLRGGPALSPFRLSRVLLRVQQKVSVVSRLQAEYRYFALLPEAGWNKAQHAVLETLLDASHAPASFRSGPLFLVVPRPGTVSPWSSKATDIAHNCGLTQIQRLERGIAWFAEVDRPLSDEEAAEVSRQLHDPMMEVVLAEEQQAARLFPAASPRPLGRIDVQNMGRAALAEANRELGLALSEEELEYLHAFFLETGRDPSDAELMMFAQANSEHCRHKVFNASWELDGQPQPHSLFAMIRNTWEKNGQGVLSAYSDNAAVMAGPDTALFFPDANTGCYGYIQEELPILMKVETHNHPTAIAPGPGAATGAGGEIRDEGATGCGGRPRAGLVGFSVSNLRIPGFVQPWEQSCGRPETIASALDIMIDGPVGAASFNNEFGRPALCGYFRTFEQQVPAAAGVEWRGYHKPIMVAGGLGNVRSQHVQKGALKPGSLLVVLGGPALEIGLGGGAASSSCSSQGQEALDFASVQRANPEMERRCQQVIDRCWQAGERNPVCFIHDVGAG
ncbi:MAG: AIR synthase-related protein, partial [Kistimonas sp.]|nr:AIR synthase-related protein [Kistimonas sp.]